MSVEIGTQSEQFAEGVICCKRYFEGFISAGGLREQGDDVSVYGTLIAQGEVQADIERITHARFYRFGIVRSLILVLIVGILCFLIARIGDFTAFRSAKEFEIIDFVGHSDDEVF